MPKKIEVKISATITKILKNLPIDPGVYLMKDEKQKILYVGKAKNLKKRVSQYFNKTPNHSLGTQIMVKHIFDIEVIKVNSELEALLLETTLIKKHKPKYNIKMRDDKNFSYIKIRKDQDFPEILIVRKMFKDKAKYFGPYSSTSDIRATLKIIQKIFPYRTCTGEINLKDEAFRKTAKLPEKVNITCKNLSRHAPCLDYHIKRCDGPCIGKISHLAYLEVIAQIEAFLAGRHDEITRELEDKIKQASKELKFEFAAKLRDRYLAVKSILEKQKVISTTDANQDVLTPYLLDENRAFVNILEIRSGKLIDSKNFELDIKKEATLEDILENFIPQYYEEVVSLPTEIISACEIKNHKILSDWFFNKFQRKIFFTNPKLGMKKNIIKIGEMNAKQYFEKNKISWQASEQEILEDLKKNFELKKVPMRIEVYDISHFGGTETTASMVVAKAGKITPELFRKFKINTVNKSNAPDDYKSMEEVFLRRLKYISDKKVKVEKKYNFKKIKLKKSELSRFSQKKSKYSKIDVFEYLLAKEKKIYFKFFTFRQDDSKIFLETNFEDYINDIEEDLLISLLMKFKNKKVYFCVKKDCLATFLHLKFREVDKNILSLKYDLKKLKLVFWQYKKEVEDKSLKEIPDLIIIDGGKGQVSTVERVCKNLKIDIPLVGFAKKENIFYLTNKQEVRFSESSKTLYFLQNIRDKAHIFANSYREVLGLKKNTRSKLDTLPGIGPKLKKRLIQQFGSISGIKEASSEQLEIIIGAEKALMLKELL